MLYNKNLRLKIPKFEVIQNVEKNKLLRLKQELPHGTDIADDVKNRKEEVCKKGLIVRK